MYKKYIPQVLVDIVTLSQFHGLFPNKLYAVSQRY